MRSLHLFLAGTLVALSLFFAISPFTAAASEPKWVLADENPGTRFYFDSAGITTPREGIIRVPVRVVYTKEGKAEALGTLGKNPGFENLFETRYAYDLDCPKKKLHLLQVIHLDDAGKQIKAVDLSAVTEWEEIPPDSRLELLAEEACPKR